MTSPYHLSTGICGHTVPPLLPHKHRHVTIQTVPDGTMEVGLGTFYHNQVHTCCIGGKAVGHCLITCQLAFAVIRSHLSSHTNTDMRQSGRTLPYHLSTGIRGHTLPPLLPHKHRHVTIQTVPDGTMEAELGALYHSQVHTCCIGGKAVGHCLITCQLAFAARRTHLLHTQTPTCHYTISASRYNGCGTRNQCRQSGS
ncbi:hypothetical protein J6590_067099 [Homalodisca vitripennis]|nr:hypothetical protein J6590_067099 [Homalodisca vitripennis]